MELRKTVLATIAYYDRLDYPLTLFEVHRFLINPQRLSPKLPPIGDISMEDVAVRLEELQELGAIREQWGMYALSGRSGLAETRLSREKIAAQKWKRFIRKARWFQAVPWIRGVFASGSLAMANTAESSDYDALIIIRSGRLYLARLLLSGLTSLMGVRRTRYELSASDKFCFNHYITTDNLAIGHESLYNAQTYAHLVPVWPDSTRLAGEFFSANLWINRYVYNFRPGQEMTGRTVGLIPGLRLLSGIIERALDNRFGDMLERWARSYQQRRIAGNPATHAAGGRVVYTDKELEFHPRSFERVVLNAYNAALQRLSISTYLEPDSGLN